MSVPPPPRAIEIKPGAVTGRVLLWLLFAAIAIGCPIGLSMQIARLDRLKSSGVEATASVLSGHEMPLSKGTKYYLEIAFKLSNASFQGEREVSSEIYGEYSNSTTVPVVTMPGNPLDFEVGRITRDTYEAVRYPWIVFGCVLGFFVLIGAGAFEVELEKEQRLLSRGIFTDAIVTGVTTGRKSMIKYEFSANGELVAGSAVQPWSWATRTVGDSVDILYNPAAPGESILITGIHFVHLRN